MVPLLKVSNLVKRFGGIVAVNDVSFEIYKGETLGFIGPNGAGKSTVVNCLTGYLPATAGKVEMNGVDISHMKPHERTHMGLARTYQIPRPFPELTALTSVLASSISGKKRINQSFQDAMYDATHYLEFVGLFSKRNILARDLTFYELRMLELARALATTPQLIFIDEVMAGLNPGEAKSAVHMIRRAKEEFGITVFWIEHVMAVLMEAADRIVAINYGAKLAEGTPEEVVNNDEVVEAYLGRGWRNMLEVSDLSASYGVIPALHGVSFNIRESEIVTILGSNGTGKSTILNVVQGMMPGSGGRIIFRDEAIHGLPSHKVVARGIVQVPEGMKSFPFMTVKENLILGAYRKFSWSKRKKTLEYVYSLFPILKERSNMAARLLSGGEQQMLKIGRGLMASPQLLMVDEPSIGLAPRIVESVYETLAKLRETGLTILLTEQNALRALQLADRGYIIQEGRIVLEGKSAELMKNDLVRKAYLGR